MKRILLLVCAVSTMVIGCATAPKPQKSQLEVRAYQTHEFEISDTKKLLKTALNVLQDEGFTIKNSDADLGNLLAAKEATATDMKSIIKGAAAGGICLGPLGCLAGGAMAKNAQQVIESNATVSEFGKKSKLRMNFQAKTYDAKGSLIKVEEMDETYYQQFFAKIDKGLFLQKQGL